MKTKEKDASTLRPVAPAASGPQTYPVTPALEPTSLDGRIIAFARSTPLFLTLENGKAHPQDLTALAAHLADSFPELKTLRARLQHLKTRRDDLTRTLMRFLKGSYPQLAALMEDQADSNNSQRNSVIDHSAVLMWELNQADDLYQKIAEELNTLELKLEEAVEASHRRFVRWAVRDSR